LLLSELSKPYWTKGSRDGHESKVPVPLKRIIFVDVDGKWFRYALVLTIAAYEIIVMNPINISAGLQFHKPTTVQLVCPLPPANRLEDPVAATLF
jgi:hypothetical protein